jgi:hypothetical protein
MTSGAEWQIKHFPSFGDGSGFAAQHAGKSHSCFYELAIGGGHLALGKVKVIFQAHTDVAAEGKGYGNKGPLSTAYPNDLPVTARRYAPSLVNEIFRRGWDSPHHPHHKAKYIGRSQNAHVYKGRGIMDVPAVKSFHFWEGAPLLHDFEEVLNIAKGILKHEVMVEALSLGGVDGVVHGTHIEGGHVGFEGSDVVDAFLTGEAHGARGKVNDNVGGSFAYFFVNLPISFHIEGGQAVGLASMDVENGSACFYGAAALLSDLFGGIGDVRTLVSGGEDACQRGCDDDFITHGEWVYFPFQVGLRFSRKARRPS